MQNIHTPNNKKKKELAKEKIMGTHKLCMHKGGKCTQNITKR